MSVESKTRTFPCERSYKVAQPSVSGLRHEHPEANPIDPRREVWSLAVASTLTSIQILSHGEDKSMVMIIIENTRNECLL